VVGTEDDALTSPVLYGPARYDPFSASVVADPYPWYRCLHGEQPVLHQRDRDIWVLVRHADVRAAVRDHARLSSADGVTYISAPLPMMLTMDPPDHERLRRIVGREFAPRDVHRFRPLVERFVEEGLDLMTTEGTADLVESLAAPVPIRVMAAILGVPESDIPELGRMSDDLVEGFKIAPVAGASDAEAAAAAANLTRAPRAIGELNEYFTALIAERRRRPADDLITKLLRPASDGTLSPDELFWFCLLLLVAGIETTTNLIGNMVLAFVEHPTQWRALRERRDLAGAAVSESLRFDAPIQGFFRTALDTYVVDDVEIPRGARVLLLFGAANRDPQQYKEPDVFRIDRNPTDHLGFGAGIHRCLGAGLAELEGRVVLEGLLERTETLEADGEVRTSNPTLRGAARLPLRLASRR
jgi:cytochrome P450